jgi:hypothetical protein
MNFLELHRIEYEFIVAAISIELLYHEYCNFIIASTRTSKKTCIKAIGLIINYVAIIKVHMCLF